MGTASLIAGIGSMLVGFAVIGQGFLGQYFTAKQMMEWIILNLIFGIPFIIVGALLLRKYDYDRKNETHSETVLPEKPKRDLKKSPTLKGVIIGIIAVSIIYGSIWGITYQAFVMTGDAMAPTINTYDLVRYDNTPFHEIQVNDIIFYSDNDKVKIHKVTQVDNSKITRTLIAKNEVSDTPHTVTESQYIGKLTSVTEGAGYITRILAPPINYIILIAVFVIPIAVMKIRG